MNKVKPFLRWAGGKTWLLKYLEDYLPKDGFNNYYEPFLGGGSVFFNLKPKSAFLSDLNEELIDTYNVLKDDPEGIIEELRKFKNTPEFYYKVRKAKFRKPTKQAANFIYLNQTSFNGIYRVNLKGEYNVPYGHRTKDFFEPENLRAASQVLQAAKIEKGDFMLISNRIAKGDLVFLDPPYTVTHYSNGFIKYNQKLFSIQDQNRLSELIDHIKSVGAFYILTNAAHEKIREIFQKGDTVNTQRRASLIGGAKAKRGKYEEHIFTNVI